ncbi:MAG: hypothetical protein ACNI3A_08330 [Desulfovibrio sp.]|uniref:rhamnosyltransferase WsaF family glycosyltransferase n=1 Tax=Desulfovibrio sp. 7SRBS1 TaxID=3378064 RepID=UPI003B3F6003
MHLVRRRLVRTSARVFPRTTSLFCGQVIPIEPSPKTALSAGDLVARRFQNTSPLVTYLSSESICPRVTMVTDSVSPGSLFGGVGTAIILSALLAEKRSARLRIITRQGPAHPVGVSQVLKAYKLELRNEPQFTYAPDFGSSPVDRQEGELFVTTSWWTTVSTLAGVPAQDILYLLQEDERMFYPEGDERQLCRALLERDDIDVVVNTKLLYDHLVETGLPHLREKGMWFEPSFPSSLFFPRPTESETKRNLVFYARPNNLRNMFYMGAGVLDEAVRRGILDLDKWEIILLGRDIPNMRIGGVEPQQYTNLPWQEYAKLAGQMDAGLCLMATPHPSYPPLDLAASGAVVLTNRYGKKQDLSAYSPNIICADLDTESLLQGLDKVLKLAENTPVREANYRKNGLQNNWRQSFNDVVGAYGGKE